MITAKPSRTMLAEYASSQDPRLAEKIVALAWPVAYRVCKKILTDSHAAEDAAQESMIRLLDRADRFEGNRHLLPWVAALAANVARDARRSSGRRARREERVARRDAQEEGADHLELEELRAAVNELPKKYREALMLRFYAGLTLKQVAAALEIPEGTAATRVRKGKKLLRKELEAKGYTPVGVTASFGWLLAGPVGSVPAVPAVAQLGAAGAGASTGSALLAALIASLLLTAGGWWWVFGGGGTPDVSKAPVAEQADADSGDGDTEDDSSSDTESSDPGSAEAANVADAASDDGRVVVTGQLIGNDLRGAWVLPALQAQAPVNESEGAAQLRKQAEDMIAGRMGRTGLGWKQFSLPGAPTPDAEGRFELRLAPGSYRLYAGAHGYKTNVVFFTVERSQHVEVPLEWLGVSTLRVEIVDLGGKPFANSPVTLKIDPPGGLTVRFTTTTDDEGVVRREVAPAEYRVQAATAEGLVTETARAFAIADQEARCRLTLGLAAATSATQSAQIRVVDREGAPVEGATVELILACPYTFTQPIYRLINRYSSSSRVTNAEGTVSIKLDRWTSGAIVAVVRHGDFGGRSAIVAIDDPERPEEIRVVLSEELGRGTLAVKLFGSADDSEPLGKETAWASAHFRIRGKLYSGQGHEGRDLQHVDLPAGPLELTYLVTRKAFEVAGTKKVAKAVAYAPVTVRVNVRAGQTSTVSLHLEPATLPLDVRVLKPDGEPFLGWLVLERPQGGRSNGNTKDGHIRFVRVSALETYTLVAAGDGYLPVRFEGLRPAEEVQTLTLPEGPIQRFEVKAEDGTPVRGAKLTVAGHAGWHGWDGMNYSDQKFVTDEAGSLVLLGELPEPCSIKAHALGAADFKQDLSPENGVFKITLTKDTAPLLPFARCSLSGKAVNALGRPLTSVAFQAIGPSGYGAGRKKLSAVDGSFKIRSESGRVILRAYRGDLGLSEPVELELEERQSRSDLRVVFKPGVRVSGTIVRELITGDERVSLLDLQGNDWSRLGRKHSSGVQVAPDGTFDLGPLPVGPWVLVLRSKKRDGDELTRQRITVNKGQPLRVTLNAD